MTQEKNLMSLLKVKEQPKLADIQKAALAAAVMGTYSRTNPTKMEKIQEEAADDIIDLINSFPFEEDETQQTTDYLLWYGFTLEAAS